MAWMHENGNKSRIVICDSMKWKSKCIWRRFLKAVITLSAAGRLWYTHSFSSIQNIIYYEFLQTKWCPTYAAYSSFLFCLVFFFFFFFPFLSATLSPEWECLILALRDGLCARCSHKFKKQSRYDWECSGLLLRLHILHCIFCFCAAYKI